MIVHYEGMSLIANNLVAEWEDVAPEDLDERWCAMTAYHICLELLPLVERTRVVLEVAPGVLVMHPNTLAIIKEAVVPSSSEPPTRRNTI